jgi:hypothetical protein
MVQHPGNDAFRGIKGEGKDEDFGMLRDPSARRGVEVLAHHKMVSMFGTEHRLCYSPLRTTPNEPGETGTARETLRRPSRSS